MNTEFPYQFLRKPLNWAVFMAVLVHVSGAIGIAFFDRNLFVSLTPVNLLLMFLLLLWNEGSLRIPFLLSLLIAFFTGLFTEMVGVHTGWLFGSYVYQPVMGPQLLEVPLLIGLNWFIVVYASFILVSRFYKLHHTAPWLIALLTALLTTLFDWLMEPVAMELGFWSWENNAVPFYNYFCWFVISLLLARIFVRIKTPIVNMFAVLLLLVQTAFFIFLRLALVSAT